MWLSKSTVLVLISSFCSLAVLLLLLWCECGEPLWCNELCWCWTSTREGNCLQILSFPRQVPEKPHLLRSWKGLEDSCPSFSGLTPRSSAFQCLVSVSGGGVLHLDLVSYEVLKAKCLTIELSTVIALAVQGVCVWGLCVGCVCGGCVWLLRFVSQYSLFSFAIFIQVIQEQRLQQCVLINALCFSTNGLRLTVFYMLK